MSDDRKTEGRRGGLAHRLGASVVLALVASLLPLGAPVWATPPANDDVASAIPVSTIPFFDTVSLAEATRSAGDPACAGTGATVWWSVTATAEARLMVRASGFEAFPAVSVWTGATGSLTQVGCDDGSDGPASVSFRTTAGQSYLLMVEEAKAEPDGDVSLSVEAIPTPPNDDITDATPVDGLPFGSDVWLTDATRTAADPPCGAGPTVWYRFVPTETQIVRVTANGDLSPVLGAYAGDPGQLQELGCATEFLPMLDFEAEAGRTYHVLLGGLTTADTGNAFVQMEVAPPPAPPNDDVANATEFTALPFTHEVDATSAWTSPDDPECGWNVRATLWYRFTPTSDTAVNVEVPSSVGPSIGVYHGQPGTWTEVACARDSERLTFAAHAGTTYYLLLALTEPGPFTVSITAPNPPPHDEQASARPVELIGGHWLENGALYRDVADVSLATAAPGDPACGAPNNHKSLWYALRSDHDVRVAVDTSGSDYHGFTSAHRRTGTGLIQVACNQSTQLQGPPIEVDLVAGETVYVVVSASGADAIGRLVLTVTERPPLDDKVAGVTHAAMPSVIGNGSAVWDGKQGWVFHGREAISFDPKTGAGRSLGPVFPGALISTSSIWDGRHAYVFGGIDGGRVHRQIWRFDPRHGGAEPAGTLPDLRYGSTAAFDGRYAYVFGGLDPPRLSGPAPDPRVVRFDPETGTSQFMTAVLPGPVRPQMAAAWDGGHVWLFSTRDILRYDPSTDVVTVMQARLPTNVGAPSAVWDGQHAYVFGGGAVYRYDTAADTVTRIGTGFTGQGSGTSAFWDGAHAYVVGGGSSVVNRIDLPSGTVTHLAPGQNAATAAVGNDVYSFGGDGLDQIARVNAGSGRLEVLDQRLPYRLKEAAAVAQGEQVYLIGGNSGRLRDEILRFDTRSGAVTDTGARLPEPREEAVATSDGRYVYVLGGEVPAFWDPTSLMAGQSIVRYDPTTGEVVTLSSTLPDFRTASLAAVWDGARVLIFGTDWRSDETDAVLALDPGRDQLVTLPGKTPSVDDPLVFWDGDEAIVVGTAWLDRTHTRAFAYNPVTGRFRMLYVSLPMVRADGWSAGHIRSDMWLLGTSGVVRLDAKQAGRLPR